MHYEMGQAVNLIGHIANTTVEKYPIIADYTSDLDFSTIVQQSCNKLETVVKDWMLENLKASENNVKQAGEEYNTQYDNSAVEQQINTIFDKIYHALTDENDNKEASSAQACLVPL
jgi:predicted metalloendopeptidase